MVLTKCVHLLVCVVTTDFYSTEWKFKKKKSEFGISKNVMILQLYNMCLLSGGLRVFRRHSCQKRVATGTQTQTQTHTKHQLLQLSVVSGCSVLTKAIENMGSGINL